uniref:Uncharacterized protein n=1 Tax=Oryza brachyantha TaxID=4533 RepID=J3LXX5_ORYBR
MNMQGYACLPPAYAHRPSVGRRVEGGDPLPSLPGGVFPGEDSTHEPNKNRRCMNAVHPPTHSQEIPPSHNSH